MENWSAFAPDFKELDENVEYEERESEFDLSDEDRSVKSGPTKADEDLEVSRKSFSPGSRWFMLLAILVQLVMIIDLKKIGI